MINLIDVSDDDEQFSMKAMNTISNIEIPIIQNGRGGNTK